MGSSACHCNAAPDDGGKVGCCREFDPQNSIAGLTMDQAAANQPTSHKSVVLVIVAILLAYAVATFAGLTAAGEAAVHDEAQAAGAGISAYWAVIPFTLLLAAIAILPLVEHTAHWWDHNLHKFYVAGNLALITLMYLAFLHPEGSLGLAAQTVEHVVIKDYIPFIVLLF
ncbi:MAG TPA: sodium:proton antiporter, partial [Pirellulales bacterium]|nr:sodium:proton antiporter [Pirellulales bacterium]